MSNTFERVYALVRQVPVGRVASYGQIARLMGSPRGARMVGYALNALPPNSGVPAHRIVNRLGGLSEAFWPQGRETHRQLLLGEGVECPPDGTIDMARYGWHGPLPTAQNTEEDCPHATARIPR